MSKFPHVSNVTLWWGVKAAEGICLTTAAIIQLELPLAESGDHVQVDPKIIERRLSRELQAVIFSAFPQLERRPVILGSFAATLHYPVQNNWILAVEPDEDGKYVWAYVCLPSGFPNDERSIALLAEGFRKIPLFSGNEIEIREG